MLELLYLLSGICCSSIDVFEQTFPRQQTLAVGVKCICDFQHLTFYERK